MMKGISRCCQECTDRYPACHDYCDKYQEALEKWNDYKKQVKEIKADEFHIYKIEKIRKEKKSKWQMK